MDKPVYLIVKFDLIDKVLYTYRLIPHLKEVKILNKNNLEVSSFVYKESGINYGTSRLWKLTTDLSKYKKETLFKAEENEFLPYFADVTQDLPGYLKIKPKTYKNCQLMAEKHAGYLQFYHEPTKDVLRIAMNSNIYRPVTK